MYSPGSLGSIIECFLYRGGQKNIVFELKSITLEIEIISELMLIYLAKASLD